MAKVSGLNLALSEFFDVLVFSILFQDQKSFFETISETSEIFLIQQIKMQYL